MTATTLELRRFKRETVLARWEARELRKDREVGREAP
jgi:hypothetical protein